MAPQSIADEFPGMWEGEGRPKRCPVCGRTSSEVTLVAPRKLPYEESKRYTGPMFCLSDAPRMNDGQGLDMVGRLHGR